ncbi:hypothetical protein [Saccharopolyspora sp. SCSIO 74807]|uniref:hypothetical protein n=1 Tax=Saccharopolyspora sp. SCSIO 74807 TaxID=3118084 RepID=UPI0030CB4850
MAIAKNGSPSAQPPRRGPLGVELVAYALDIFALWCELTDQNGPATWVARPLAVALRGIAQWLRNGDQR